MTFVSLTMIDEFKVLLNTEIQFFIISALSTF